MYISSIQRQSRKYTHSLALTHAIHENLSPAACSRHICTYLQCILHHKVSGNDSVGSSLCNLYPSTHSNSFCPFYVPVTTSLYIDYNITAYMVSFSALFYISSPCTATTSYMYCNMSCMYCNMLLSYCNMLLSYCNSYL